MASMEQEKPFLDSDSDVEEGGMQQVSRRVKSSRWTQIVLCISLILNVGLLVDRSNVRLPVQRAVKQQAPLEYLSTLKSPYSGLGFDTQIKYTHFTDYVSSNKTLADQKWEEVENLLVVQVTEDFIKEKQLPHSWTFPWDLDKRIYFPKVGHQLHCLKSMRRAFHDMADKGSSVVTLGHVDHCLDSLRQDLMCQADDTPMPSLIALGGLGEDQVMQCKNWDKVMEWITGPEHNACYKHMNTYKGVKHPIERYQFCPKDSEYFPIMQEYFDVHPPQETIEDLG